MFSIFRGRRFGKWTVDSQDPKKGGFSYFTELGSHEIPGQVQLQTRNTTNIMVIWEIKSLSGSRFSNFPSPFHATSANPLTSHRTSAHFWKNRTAAHDITLVLVVRHHRQLRQLH